MGFRETLASQLFALQEQVVEEHARSVSSLSQEIRHLRYALNEARNVVIFDDSFVDHSEDNMPSLLSSGTGSPRVAEGFSSEPPALQLLQEALVNDDRIDPSHLPASLKQDVAEPIFDYIVHLDADDTTAATESHRTRSGSGRSGFGYMDVAEKHLLPRVSFAPGGLQQQVGGAAGLGLPQFAHGLNLTADSLPSFGPSAAVAADLPPTPPPSSCRERPEIAAEVSPRQSSKERLSSKDTQHSRQGSKEHLLRQSLCSSRDTQGQGQRRKTTLTSAFTPPTLSMVSSELVDLQPLPSEDEQLRETESLVWEVREAWSRHSSRTMMDVALGSPRGPSRRAQHIQSRRLRSASFAASPVKPHCLEKLMLDPSSRRRFIWDSLASALIIYDAITLPWSWAFGWALPSSSAQIAMLWVLVLFFTLDIPLTCLTGFHTEGRVIMDPYLVFKNYAKTYLWVDILAVVPDWISIMLDNHDTEGSSGYFRISKTMRMLRILRTIKLIRLARLHRFARDFIASISSEYWVGFLKVAKLSALLLLTCHYVACGWFAVGDEEGAEGWVRRIDGDSFSVKYLTCLEWSLAFYTGSESDAVASTGIELFYKCTIAFMSVLCESYLVSSFTNTMSQVARFHGQNMQRRWQMLQYLHEQRISKPLQTRVRKYLFEVGQPAVSSRDSDLAEVFSNMPAFLIMEINAEVMKPVLGRNNFLYTCVVSWPHLMHKLCQDCIMEVELIDEEVLFAVDEECQRLTFPLRGSLRYDLDHDVHEQVDKHRWYSEAGLCLAFVHCGSMICTSSAHFVCLVVRPFERFISSCPPLHREMIDAAYEFRSWVIEQCMASSFELTDLTTMPVPRRSGTGGFADMMMSINPNLRLLKTPDNRRTDTKSLDFYSMDTP